MCEDINMTVFLKCITAIFSACVLSVGYDAKQGSSLMIGYLSACIYGKQQEDKHKITFQIYLFLH